MTRLFNEFIGPIQQWLGWAWNDIETFNTQLRQKATAAIAARRKQIEGRNEHLALSSIPVGRREAKSKTRVADVIVRRPAPKLSQ